MSRELVVLTRERPDLDAFPALVFSVDAELRVFGTCVFDTQDRLLVRVQEPVLIKVPGEVERLLGTTAEPPFWWLELRAASDPVEAKWIARHCADALATRHDGTVWSESAT